MIKRFQIEDWIVQDESGVVFRALDAETGRTVAVRRFFPFGAHGGGLNDEEQTAYNIAIARLADISHPALRSVICGGCDPVDGMPFIATEWVEGESLLPIVIQGPLTVKVAAALLTQALEVSELLSQVFSEDAVWVETALQTIIVGSPESGRGFTFWISPLKWLGGNGENRGLESIVGLTEEIMHLSGKKIGDEAARGLGGWLNWLRTSPAASLRGARESLAAAIGAEPPSPVRKAPPRPAPHVKKPVKRSKPKTFLFVNTGLAILTACLGAWLYLQSRAKQGTLPGFIPAAIRNILPPPIYESGMADAEPDEMETAEAAEISAPASQSTAAEQSPAAIASDDVIAWNNNKLLAQYDGKQVVVGGLLLNAATRKGSPYLYLDFSKNPGKNDFRGIIKAENAPPDLTVGALLPLSGKHIRIHGRLFIQKNGGLRRPVIKINRRDSIEVLE